MNDNYVQQRVKEIYDAYERSGKTKNYKITLTPLNGNGDVHVQMVRSTKIKDRIIREKVILKGEDLSTLSQEK